MLKIDETILGINKVICGNISKFDDSERGLLSQNILSQLRNLVEHISLKALSGGKDIENTYDNITQANAFVCTRGNLRFLTKFHNLLQITASHYTLDEENSERLMLKYYEYLLKIKTHLKNSYNLDVLENIDDFPLHIDPAFKEYYEKIATKLNQVESARLKSAYNDRYYIQKIKPFFSGHEVYYEVTFTVANDKASKFDRIIAFTKLDLSPNYAVKLAISNDEIEVLGKKMPIQIIDGWEVSIRPCELDRFADFFGKHTKMSAGTIEYRELMAFLSKTGLSLVEVIKFPENYYNRFREILTKEAQVNHILAVLDKSRELVAQDASGSNLIKYLIYKLNNKILKQQYSPELCDRLSNLHFKYGCIPFDAIPFNFSLNGHNPKLSDLFACIDVADREDELFARHIRNNTEIRGQLYTPRVDITGFENIDELILTYNTKLYHKHKYCSLEDYKGHIFICEYEDNTREIIEKLKVLSSKGIKNYSNSVDAWLQSSAYKIDSDEKQTALKLMFEKSEVALIYGSAGTGKTTLINHISNFFHDSEKLYLANTNPAVENLKRRVNTGKSTFKTIAKFLSPRNTDIEYDILIIDECSTVNNSDMLSVLEKASFKLLVLVGDVFQIESIRFGNWFGMVRGFVPETSVFELVKPYRTNNEKLLDLWGRVRNIDEDILEHITKNDYSITLNDTIFEHSGDDSIILCLNYDGLYGINNINKFLQGSNQNVSVQWGVQTYKVSDPVLFNESERFAPLIYNNLKGKIVGIEVFEDKIRFDLELDRVINQFDALGYDLELLDNSSDGKSVVRFFVNKLRSTDEDDDSSSLAVVPFQVAYAVSIHKAQGLEYSSVKVVITNEIEEMITHNIFYTAITRAKDKLQIYWTPETENKVLSSLEKKNIKKDVALLKSKFAL